MYPRIVCVVCLGLFFQPLSLAQSTNSPSEAASAIELPFRLSSGYLIQVEGRIGTQTNLKFVLDTGATISVVDRKIADKLNLELRPAESLSFDRKLRWESATIPEVQFGPVHATHAVTLVGNLAEYSEFARNADAVIGMDLLKLSNFSVDFATRKIIFHPFSQKASAVRDEPLSNCLILEVQVQGHPVRLIVDTGLPGVLFYEARLRKQVPVLRTVAGSVTRVTMGGRLQAKQAILPDVLLGKKHGDVPVLLVQSPPPEMRPGIDGIVGIAPLKAHHVDFDFSSKTLSWN